MSPSTCLLTGISSPCGAASARLKATASFPRQGHGVETGQQPPSFQSKKVRGAMEQQGLCRRLINSANKVYSTQNDTLQSTRCNILETSHRVSLPPCYPRRQPARLPSRRSIEHKSRADARRRWRGQPQTRGLATAARTATSWPPSSDRSRRSLGASASDIPSYRVEPDEGMPNFFSGRPVFKNGRLVPPDLGVVSGVLGQRPAKRQMAEEVLDWLQGQSKDEFVKSLWPQDP